MLKLGSGFGGYIVTQNGNSYSHRHTLLEESILMIKKSNDTILKKHRSSKEYVVRYSYIEHDTRHAKKNAMQRSII